MKKLFVLAGLAASAAFAWQSTLKLDHLDRLASKATDSVTITLDSSLLRLASAFVNDDDDEDAAEIKKLVAGLKGIYVRSFEFKNSGEYADTDVEDIRAQLHDPAWKRIVQVRSKVDGDADVYLRMNSGHIEGLTVICAEPKELTVINIDGNIDLEGLSKLEGKFGIPKSLPKTLQEKKDEKKSEEKK